MNVWAAYAAIWVSVSAVVVTALLMGKGGEWCWLYAIPMLTAVSVCKCKGEGD